MKLLFGNSKYSNEIDLQILIGSIDFILTSKRFDEPLLNLNTQSRALTFRKKCLICLNESPLKMMENSFYFILKALFILSIFKFLSDFLVK